MLHREIVAVCSEISTNKVTTLCGQNVEILFVNIFVKNTNWALKAQMISYLKKINIETT
jgi:hypothetical protein